MVHRQQLHLVRLIVGAADVIVIKQHKMIHVLTEMPLLDNHDDFLHQRRYARRGAWCGHQLIDRLSGIFDIIGHARAHRQHFTIFLVHAGLIDGVQSENGNLLIELTAQSLIGAEHYRSETLDLPALALRRRAHAFLEHNLQSHLHGPVVVVQRLHGLLILTDAHGSQSFHRLNHR